MAYFEISNSYWWSLGPMRRILCSVTGVEGFKRQWFNEQRYVFSYLDTACVVWEPWGDNSRYWIGPNVKDSFLNMAPINEAFRQYRFGFTFDREFRV
jgi:hypothetical protein